MTRAAAIGSVAMVAIACSPPIGVRRMDPRAVQRQLTASELSTGEPSVPSRIVLQRRGLMQQFDENPKAALAALHREVVAGTAGPDELFALAELSFHYAQHGGGRPNDLAAAVYAWAFLFPERDGPPPDCYDRRLRLAIDLYNRAITAGFEPYKAHELELRGGRYELPFGTLDVTVDRTGFRWGNRELTSFVPVGELEVRGLRNRYRQAGIGAALAASTKPIDPTAWDFVPPRVKVPVTALLRIANAREGLVTGDVSGTIELYAASETRDTEIGGREVPLEIEPTAALAYQLAESRLWERELKGFLSGDLLFREQRQTRLYALEPYRRGRVPVVFVHGTASSPARWAEMVNDLENDPRIRKRFQFWVFVYDTGNPIAYSAMLLRRSLREAIAHLDPDATDACLSRMVIIGHSQGGLLAKMTVIDTGDKLWRNVSDRPLEDLSLKPETRALLKEALFLEPVPSVSRVVFIATPHRGSFQARAWVADLLARLVKMPSELTGLGVELLTLRRERAVFAPVKRIPTSVENMSPANPFIRTLATIPVAPGVHAHSIIAVKGDGPPEKGNDGVVTYQSAHVEGVESELVVRSPHSVQGNPEAIEEVRRILLLHDAELRRAGDACIPGAAPAPPGPPARTGRAPLLIRGAHALSSVG
jgi:pimeloyl-ACP methyl ester carboxylesterase